MTRTIHLGGIAVSILWLTAGVAAADGPFPATSTTLSTHCSTVVLPPGSPGSPHPYVGCGACGTSATGLGSAGGCGQCQAGGCQGCGQGCYNCPDGCQDCDCGCQDGLLGGFFARMRGRYYRMRKENYFCRQSYCTMYTAPVCPPYCHPSHGYYETCWRPFPHLPSRCPLPFLPAPYPEFSEVDPTSEVAPAPEPATNGDNQSPVPAPKPQGGFDYEPDTPMTRLLVPPNPTDLKPTF